MEKLKEGQWVLRKWDKQSGGETDFTQFVSLNNDSIATFNHSSFFRVRKERFSILSQSGTISCLDQRMETQWRPTTKKELEKFLEMTISQMV